jgi:F0F1-type ATP synthase beta subunit
LGKHFKVVIAILGLDEFFTNSPGQYVKLQATISGLTGLVDGMYDQWELAAYT